MIEIIFDRKKHGWVSSDRKFLASERDVPFSTVYRLINPETGKHMDFHLSHSTGPEFDHSTRWVYVNESSDITLEICNDPGITGEAARRYLEAKLKNY